MNWDNVNVDAVPQRAFEHLAIWQHTGQVGRFMLELNILTGHAELWEWPQGVVTLKGPMDNLINEAIIMYNADPFGSFAYFLKRCRCKALFVLYFSPEYNKAVRNLRLR